MKSKVIKEGLLKVKEEARTLLTYGTFIGACVGANVGMNNMSYNIKTFGMEPGGKDKEKSREAQKQGLKPKDMNMGFTMGVGALGGFFSVKTALMVLNSSTVTNILQRTPK
ncbi:MAG: hypothetical protein HYX60_10390 [Legionella longbeachae]|nr:hypothetical protein [Legionella longbeachae]